MVAMKKFSTSVPRVKTRTLDIHIKEDQLAYLF
jgi:hypothetical protein